STRPVSGATGTVEVADPAGKGVGRHPRLRRAVPAGLHDITQLGDRARQGCRIRVLLADPNGAAVRRRGEEEGFGIGLAHRVLLSLRYYEPILAIPGVQVRLHDTTLYASIFRVDETMLVNTHVYGSTAAHNPVLHLRRVPGGRVVDHYLASFDRVWTQAKPTSDIKRGDSHVRREMTDTTPRLLQRP
ncbi:DUF5919 domain-containing protein, partial [Salinispora arenicola]|uniref:DUF5919 domain-containing protein n=1 Tax=Salinispora arenicola TaxID=168697 RepID=UPI0027DD097B